MREPHGFGRGRRTEPRFLSALLLLVPAISALQLAQPTTQVRTQSPITITWTTASGDPATFDLCQSLFFCVRYGRKTKTYSPPIDLTNDAFRNTFALKNVVTTSDRTISVVIPVVEPG